MNPLHATRLLLYLFVGGFFFPGCQPEKGEPGTANVQYSPWIPTTFTGSSSTYTANIPALPITQEVLDKADIRVYWRESGRVISLPYAEVIGGATYSVHQRFYVGRIELKASYMISNQEFRYVIIPGGVATARRSANPKLDYSDYEAVRRAFNLPD